MNIGHGNAAVREAIKKQVDDYMHLMVYGEIIETPQVQYAKRLAEFLPPSLNCVYFTNSGAEATEGAMKLAKRLTGRSRIVAFNDAYHGSTQGALSIMGGEYWRNAYRPLLPDVVHVDFNAQAALDAITCYTACVVMEVVQAEAGAKPADRDWLQALRQKCTEMGVLLVFDEIQTSFGRTGTLWAFEQYGVVPDILLLGKALGGGLPIGAFISSYQNMQALTANPVLGHITTFGGHPVCCAAGLAGFEELLKMTDDGEKMTDDSKKMTESKGEVKAEVKRIEVKVEVEGGETEVKVEGEGEEGEYETKKAELGAGITEREDAKMMLYSSNSNELQPVICHLSSVISKSARFRSLLKHPAIKAIHGRGLLLAVEFESAVQCQRICHACVQAGMVTDWFLFAPNCLRVAPPLIITEQQIEDACKRLLEVIDRIASQS
jgi:acetylornithine/succinyldiaminopimelate/putrescine aminotransferase